MTALKSMTSKFNGKCFRCKSKIFAGSPIFWSKKTGAKHFDCSKVTPTVETEDKLKRIHTTELGDYTAVYAMFASAAKTNKFPRITINADGFEFHLYVSGPQAKIPGVINVKKKGGGYGHLDWFGRITTEGTWTHRVGVDERMADALSKLQMDPVAAVAEFGKLCGRCCFCNSSLSDLKSVDVGYGPVCAKKWALPYGKKAKPGNPAMPAADKMSLAAELLADDPHKSKIFESYEAADASLKCEECGDSGYLPPYSADFDTPCYNCSEYEKQAATAGV